MLTTVVPGSGRLKKWLQERQKLRIFFVGELDVLFEGLESSPG
jgi:hypothetical protein